MLLKTIKVKKDKRKWILVKPRFYLYKEVETKKSSKTRENASFRKERNKG